LPSQRADLDILDGGNDLDVVIAIPTLSIAQATALDVSFGCVLTLDDSPPPLRLHLLHQILLI
jgi:hypothetical protein